MDPQTWTIIGTGVAVIAFQWRMYAALTARIDNLQRRPGTARNAQGVAAIFRTLTRVPTLTLLHLTAATGAGSRLPYPLYQMVCG